MMLRRLILLAATGSFTGLLWLTYEHFVRTGAGQRFEDSALMGVHGRGQGFQLTGAAAELTGFQNTNAMMMLVALLAAVAVIGVLRARFWRTAAALGVLAGSSLLTRVLKSSVLDRPSLNWDNGGGHNSFPSGHVTLAAAATAAIMMVVPARVRPYVCAVGAGWTGLVGTSVVASGWHRLSDVLGGVLLVGAVTALALFLLDGRDGSPAPRFSVTNMLGAGSVWLLMLVVVGGTVMRDATRGASDVFREDWDQGNWANATASIALAGIGGVVVMALLGLVVGRAGHRIAEPGEERIEWQAEIVPQPRFGYPQPVRPGGYASPPRWEHPQYAAPGRRGWS